MLIALPLQQWLHERASLLHYTYISCIVYEYSSKIKKKKKKSVSSTSQNFGQLLCKLFHSDVVWSDSFWTEFISL